MTKVCLINVGGLHPSFSIQSTISAIFVVHVLPCVAQVSAQIDSDSKVYLLIGYLLLHQPVLGVAICSTLNMCSRE